MEDLEIKNKEKPNVTIEALIMKNRLLEDKILKLDAKNELLERLIDNLVDKLINS